jgi:P22 coat protein - gene protein 5.
MSIDNFIPAVWSARILENLQKRLVYGAICNRDYEGEIREYGDRVKINSIGAVTIGDYVKNTDMGSPETLTGDQKELIIDQSKFFNFQVDDIDKAQQKPKVMVSATQNAGYGLADVADKFIAGLYTGSTNFIGSDGAPVVLTTPEQAYNYLVDLGVKLDESNTPTVGRWVVVPPWFEALLRLDKRFIASGNSGSDQAIYQGITGYASGFTIYKSNNVPSTDTATAFKIQAGFNGTLSFAAQITDVEAYRPEQRFADALKGLAVYGAKLVRPDTMAVLVVNRFEA